MVPSRSSSHSGDGRKRKRNSMVEDGVEPGVEFSMNGNNSDSSPGSGGRGRARGRGRGPGRPRGSRGRGRGGSNLSNRVDSQAQPSTAPIQQYFKMTTPSGVPGAGGKDGGGVQGESGFVNPSKTGDSIFSCLDIIFSDDEQTGLAPMGGLSGYHHSQVSDHFHPQQSSYSQSSAGKSGKKKSSPSSRSSSPSKTLKRSAKLNAINAIAAGGGDSSSNDGGSVNGGRGSPPMVAGVGAFAADGSPSTTLKTNHYYQSQHQHLDLQDPNQLSSALTSKSSTPAPTPSSSSQQQQQQQSSHQHQHHVHAPSFPSASLNPTRLAQSYIRAPPVPLSSLRSQSPFPRGLEPPPRPSSGGNKDKEKGKHENSKEEDQDEGGGRLFGLEHCPVFFPTEKEFEKPMEFIEAVCRDHTASNNGSTDVTMDGGDDDDPDDNQQVAREMMSGGKGKGKGFGNGVFGESRGTDRKRGVKDWGIFKVVPPQGWKPDFTMDTEVFRFKTRLQRLNSMEASARANLNFLEQLFLFHTQRDSAKKTTIPQLGKRPLDLWALRKEVQMWGGFDQVTQKRKWAAVTKAIGYNVLEYPALSYQVKNAYVRIIKPFDEYIQAKKGEEVIPAPRTSSGRIPNLSGKPAKDPPVQSNSGGGINGIPGGGTGTMRQVPKPAANGKMKGKVSIGSVEGVGSRNSGMFGTPGTMDRVKEAEAKLNEVLGGGGTAADNDAHYKMPPGEVCEFCENDDRPEAILLCDGCERGWHLQCLRPPLSSVPKSESWLCDECLKTTGTEFGFDEGQEHSLYTFKRRADAFREQYLATHPSPSATKPRGRSPKKQNQGTSNDIPASSASTSMTHPDLVETSPKQSTSRALDSTLLEEVTLEDHVEREFWRMVESPHETVEVEYGADIHSTSFGSGLPNHETEPLNPYSRDGWNLNNLPILPGSLLRYVKSDISGMTIPWVYVGMMFSTFAWHKEDHFTYSINYQSWGATKTWYGVPGADDVKLEATMKAIAPDLFATRPDILSDLTTLLSPGRLKEAGVRVCVADQRPNEFIITCPRAYHAGFNHGLNYNTAVNFALPDWLDADLASVKLYRELGKGPVFSHDELCITIAQHERSGRASRWLLPHFQEMYDREMTRRERVRKVIPDLIERLEEEDQDEDRYVCETCKAHFYLSQIVDEVSNKVSCHDHYLDTGNGKKILHLRFSDDELEQMLQKVRSRSDKAGNLGQSLVGAVEEDQRKSGRKRMPSRAAMEAVEAGGEISVGQAIKRAKLDPSVLKVDNVQEVDEDGLSEASEDSEIPTFEQPLLSHTDIKGSMAIPNGAQLISSSPYSHHAAIPENSTSSHDPTFPNTNGFSPNGRHEPQSVDYSVTGQSIPSPSNLYPNPSSHPYPVSSALFPTGRNMDWTTTPEWTTHPSNTTTRAREEAIS